MVVEVSRALGHLIRLFMPLYAKRQLESVTNIVPRDLKVIECLIFVLFNPISCENRNNRRNVSAVVRIS